MSYFTAEPGEQTSFLETLVKEKGEQWKDPEALAKGYVKAQEHIASLERQTNELREDLGKSTTVDELLAEIQKNQTPAVGDPSGTNNSSQAPATTGVSEEDIKSLIEKTISDGEAQRTHQENLKLADQRLTEAFGTDASAKVDERAKVLGLTKERLAEIAGESPEAFLALVGEAPKVDTNATSTGTVNTQTDSFMSPSNKRTWETYQELRRKNKKEYYDPKIQLQLMEDVAAGLVVLPQN